MKIAVLGGSGFVGSNIIKELIKNNYEIDIYSKSKISNSVINGYVINHFELSDLDQSIYHEYYDMVIYCIGKSDYNQNISSTKEFKYFCNHIRTKTLIYISSSSIYMGKCGIVTESNNKKSDYINNYAINKICEEKIVKNSKNIQKKIILRPRAIYGVGDRILLYNILDKLIIGHIPYLGISKSIMSSLTHINTLTDFILYIIKNKNIIKSGQNIFNIADENPYNLYEIFKAINRQFFKRNPISISYLYILYIYKIGLISKNYYKGMMDIFGGNKVLNLDKLHNIGFRSSHNFHDTLPIIHNRRKEKVGSISNMRNNRNNLPWMT